MTTRITLQEDTPEYEKRKGVTHITIEPKRVKLDCDAPFSQCLDCLDHNFCERYHRHRRGK